MVFYCLIENALVLFFHYEINIYLICLHLCFQKTIPGLIFLYGSCLTGKTFPSLVVVARPYLRAKDSAVPSDRSSLDSKVKSVLMHTPMKFTEWLIQQGLVRSEQWCAIHAGNKLKLGKQLRNFDSRN